MPISDRVLRSKSVESGKVKIGGKGEPRKTSGGKIWSPPEKFENENGPFFVITKTMRESPKDRESNFVVDTALMEKLKPHCDPDGMLRKIPIMLHSSDIEEVFPTRLAAYNGTKLFCAGDGEHPATRYDQDKPRQVECICDYYDATTGIMCKPAGNLWMTILADGMTSLATRHVFRTHAKGTIKALSSGLQDVRNMVGILHGVKMWLKVMWRFTEKADGTPVRVAVVYLDMLLEDVPGAQKLAIAQAQHRAHVVQLVGPGPRLSLPAPGDPRETPAEQAAAAREWFPTRLPIVGDGPIDDDDDNEAEDLDYDPKTGVVRQSNEPIETTATATNAALPSSTTAAAATSVAPPAVSITPEQEADPIKTHQTLYKALAAALKNLSILRGAEGKDAIVAMNGEILADLTTQEWGNAVKYGELTVGQGDYLLGILRTLIVEAEKRRAEES